MYRTYARIFRAEIANKFRRNLLRWNSIRWQAGGKWKSERIIPRKYPKMLLAFTFTFSDFFRNIDTEEKLDKTMQEGKEYMEKEEYAKASVIYRRAMILASKCRNIEKELKAKEKLGAIAFHMENYDMAEKWISDVKTYLLMMGAREDDVRVMFLTLNLAEIYSNAGKYSKAEEAYTNCVKNFKPKAKKALETKDEECITLYIRILISCAYYHMHRHNYDMAFKYFKKAHKICVAFRGEISESTVRVLRDMGMASLKKGDIGAAIMYLKKAVETGQHLPGMKELSSIHVKLGTLYLQQSMIKEAEMECTQGLKNATRHAYAEGVEEATECLLNVKKAKA